ncbi:MAG: hypothetical protein LBU66_02150, partial [Treponema sp.]|nr:hypothetical protein [Treponema sp.]
PEVFSLSSNAAANPALDIWLKLDAGTPEWYQKINRSAIPHRELIAKIREFTACVPVTIQTMLCAINVKPPPPEETIAWESLLYELAANGHLRKVQLYGKARPAPEDPLTKPLPISYLEERAASLQKLIGIPVKVYP